MSDIGSRLVEVQARIAAAAERVSRDPGEVRLVAVSKTFPLHVLQDAIEAGVTDLGENRAAEFQEKVEVLGRKARWHFVGHLQTNKARAVIGADLIHSVDRLGLAEALHRRAGRAEARQDVLLEVNVSGEATKHGVEPARLVSLAEQVAELSRLRIRGLMTMAPRSHTPDDSRPVFEGLRSLSEDLLTVIPDATELSMGMTDDFEVAIEEGATIVRVGRAIFGERTPRAVR